MRTFKLPNRCLVIPAAALSLALTQFATSQTRYTLPGDNVFPEGVAYDSAAGNLFVGSTTDGAIYRGDLDTFELDLFLSGGEDGRYAVTGLEVDTEGRLFVAGRLSGNAWVYDAETGALLAELRTPAAEATLLNDVAITTDAAYFTDSLRPVIFRVLLTADGVGAMEPWLDLTQTPLRYRTGESFQERLNLNGVVATRGGRYLISVQDNTGQLWRIDTQTQEVVQIDLGGATFTTGDGLALDAQTLYVLRRVPGEIVPVTLSGDFTEGEAGQPFSDPTFRFPSTLAFTGNRLLVVNSQLDRDQQNLPPELPFTVSSVPLPVNQDAR